MTHTYTLAALEVSPATYREVRRLIEEAGQRRERVDEDGSLDMQGIALQTSPGNGGSSDDAAAIARAVLAADAGGRIGCSEHWVNRNLLPALAREGLTVVKRST